MRVPAYADRLNDDDRAFTTTEVWQQGFPILFVSHDVDGDWQFMTGGTPEMENGLVIHLRHVFERFPELLELADLPRGWEATRPHPDAPWQRAELVDDRE
jgi:hypothetical protein